MSQEPLNCPHCKVSLLGEEIPEQIRQHYASATHWKREIEVQIRGLYDGIWYYRCPDCDGTWGGMRARMEEEKEKNR